jgi:hypothetical protein
VKGIEASRNRRFTYTEKGMADSFQELLRSREGLPGIGAFDRVYREVNCHQGRPDFLALRNSAFSDVGRIPVAAGIVGASILSMLKPVAPRTLNYITSRSGYTRDAVKRSLRHLQEHNLVEQIQSGTYRLGEPLVGSHTEIWSFELKLENPRRAVYQAQQTRAFSEMTIVVVPPTQDKPYEKYSGAMGRWGIGLATFDPTTGEFRLVVRTRKSKVLSRVQYIYTLSQFGL